MKSKSLIVLAACIQISLLAAFRFTDHTCKEYNLGSSWYCKSEEKKAENEVDEITADKILGLPVAPEQKAIMLNALWEVQTKRAVITGDKADLKRFLETHRLIASKGVNFARNIHNLIETTPAFSNDQSYLRNIAESAMKDYELKQTLLNASQKYALVFVYVVLWEWDNTLAFRRIL
jgi:F plasmid transfer operon protein